MIDEVYFWHADKHRSLVQVNTMIKVPIIRSLHIFAISPEMHGCKVDFLPTNEHQSFLQVDSITLDLRSQAYPKYPKQ